MLVPIHSHCDAQVSAAGILFTLVGLVFCIELGVAGDHDTGRQVPNRCLSSALLPFDTANTCCNEPVRLQDPDSTVPAGGIHVLVAP